MNNQVNHKGTVTLKTKRLILRKILPEDCNEVYTWMSDPEVNKYERWQLHPTPQYSRGYIIEVFDGYKSNLTYQWGMELDGKLIGSVSVVGIDDFDQKADIGYALARKYWNHGYTTEAVKSVIDFMFMEVGLNRLEANHGAKNPASGKVLRKAGMRLEGHAMEFFYSNSGFQDSDLYGLTRSAYLEKK